MSREVRRVPLDFTWPLGKVWHGYLMPDELRPPQCPDCAGNGSSGAGQWLNTLCRRIKMLVDDVHQAQAAGRPMHPWLADDQYPPTRDVMRPVTEEERADAQAEIDRCEAEGRGARGHLYRMVKPGAVTRIGYEVVRPSAEIVDLAAGLAGQPTDRLGGMFGMSSSDAYRMARKIVEAAGLDPDVFGYCPTCAGEGDVGTAEQRAAAEAWEGTGPPTGDGWQLWETTSEGSPTTPVFETAEELIDYLVRCDGYREAAARQVVGDGGTLGSGMSIGGEVFDAARDADRIAARLAGRGEQ